MVDTQMKTVLSLQLQSNSADVTKLLKRLESAAEFTDSFNKGWTGHKIIMPILQNIFEPNKEWTDKLDAILKEPQTMAAKTLADKQQSVYITNLTIRGDVPRGPEDELAGDYCDVYMIVQQRLLGINLTPWHVVHTFSYGTHLMTALAIVKAATTFPTATEMYTKGFSPMVDMENNCAEYNMAGLTTFW